MSIDTEKVIPKLSSVADQIFAEIKSSQRISDNQLSSLSLLFDKHFDKASQIVDQGGVFAFIGEHSQRRVYQVQGHKSEDKYTVFPHHYCSCQSFIFDVLKTDAVYCKHQLAVFLAESLGKAKTTVISDLVLVDILQRL